MRTASQFMSIPKAAALLGRSEAAMRRAIKRGAVPAVKIPGCQSRVKVDVVAAILENAGKPSPLREPKNSDTTQIRLREPVGAA